MPTTKQPRILCIVVDSGGHRTLAQALMEALPHQIPNQTLFWEPTTYRKFLPIFYWMAVHAPQLARLCYTVFEAPLIRTLYAHGNNKSVASGLEEQVKMFKPDILINTYGVLNGAVATVAKRHPTLVTIFCPADPVTIPPSWFLHLNYAAYLALTPQHMTQLVSHYVDPKKIHQIGWPLRRSFLQHRTTDSSPVSVYVGGSVSGGPIVEFVQRMHAAYPHPCTAHVVCGKNTNLLRKLQQILNQPSRCTFVLHGYVSDPAQLLSTCAVAVGKPGPNSMFEAAHLGLPYFVLGTGFAQETANIALWKQLGLGKQFVNARQACAELAKYQMGKAMHERVKLPTTYRFQPQKFAQLIATLANRGQLSS